MRFEIALGLLAAWAGSGAAQGVRDEPELEARMFELINREREAREVPPLHHLLALQQIARRHSLRMAAAGEVSHEVDGTLMEERIRNVVPESCRVAENISKHFTIDYALADLLGSTGHRKNILSPDFTLIGIGIARGKDKLLYITQDFAGSCDRPPSRKP